MRSGTCLDVSRGRSEVGPKLVVVMVGLPARGKSYIVKKLKRYLSWLGFEAKIFNVGNRRRRRLTMVEPETPSASAHGHDSTFFDPNNVDAKAMRNQVAMDCLEEILSWLQAGGKIGIHDATNSTKERRRAIIDRCAREPGVSIMFVESICTDPLVLARNMRLKLSGPDYQGIPEERAMKDFTERVRNYERAYESLGAEEEECDNVQSCQLINVGRKVIATNIQSYLASQVVFYLMNMNLAPRQIWLTRHGESTDNILGRIAYAAALARLVAQERRQFVARAEASEATSIRDGPFHVWTSCMKRTIQTADPFAQSDDCDVQHFKFLNEIYAGDCEGLTYAEIEARFPEEYHARQQDKLRYRYIGTGGESYLDVIERLNPLIVELERQRHSVLVITHRVVMRALLAYYGDIPLDRMVTMVVPLHTAYCIEPRPFGAVLRRFRYHAATDGFTEEPNGSHDG
ncbi:6-phosphofructo-2-kinase-domain-containing protein [Syncephalis pseudoplumigaleata]|uniref:6-phosphofructo-2-kinase-domain-containing protein n=1 Tax=Syncephalis pseudoplumigaleata TaxID=1712513 RepID=A0A4P9Z6K9_9FUNG|nr:6-phosphofructo-2-kinase-domain-containing protein [Syncephalis pseudoplumigaleata]|eukprot:RKP27310.1 6-phosphofructo-2-kinase-domain-containing protein [Syncephalis pseudoplumigaleata]